MSQEVLAVVAGEEITQAEFDAFYRGCQESSNRIFPTHSSENSAWNN